jgi:hypothetical protein
MLGSRRRTAAVFVAASIGCTIAPSLADRARAAHASETTPATDALPRAHERLARPLALPKCGAVVVEWKSTPDLRDETTPSARAMEVIDDTCARAIARYPEFLEAKSLPHDARPRGALPALSLLPANVLLDGADSRNLNDVPARFAAVAPGCCYWGLYVDSLKHLFIRNDPLMRDDAGELVANPHFVRTLDHEIAHVMNARLGVVDYTDRDRDEALAEEFVAFLGIDLPTESSWEDLEHHKAKPRPGSPADSSRTAKRH